MDLSDPLVREMANRNHVPHEMWTHCHGEPSSGYVECAECRESWPCATRQALKRLAENDTPSDLVALCHRYRELRSRLVLDEYEKLELKSLAGSIAKGMGK